MIPLLALKLRSSRDGCGAVADIRLMAKARFGPRRATVRAFGDAALDGAALDGTPIEGALRVTGVVTGSPAPPI